MSTIRGCLHARHPLFLYKLSRSRIHRVKFEIPFGHQVDDLCVTKPGGGQVQRSFSCPWPGAGYPRVIFYIRVALPDHPERAALAAGPFTRPRRTAIRQARSEGDLPEPCGGEGSGWPSTYSEPPLLVLNTAFRFSSELHVSPASFVKSLQYPASVEKCIEKHPLYSSGSRFVWLSFVMDRQIRPLDEDIMGYSHFFSTAP